MFSRQDHDSLTPEQREDLMPLAINRVFDAYAKVSVYCESGREFHSRRGIEKYYLGLFVRLFEQDLNLISPAAASQSFHYDHPGPKVWRSVAVPRSREYHQHDLKGTGMESWRERILESNAWHQVAEGSGLDVYEFEKELVEEGLDVQQADIADQVFPAVQPGDTASTLPSRWAHDTQLPEHGYQYAKHIAQAENQSVWFQMTCPCGYRIRRISEKELTPTLDRLAKERTLSISIQDLLGKLSGES